MFHSFFSSLERFKCLSIFSVSFIFTLLCTKQQVFFCRGVLLINSRSCFLASSFPHFLHTYSLSFLGCKAFCIVIYFLVLWSNLRMIQSILQKGLPCCLFFCGDIFCRASFPVAFLSVWASYFSPHISACCVHFQYSQVFKKFFLSMHSNVFLIW